jgi:hypothetical protein
MTVQKDLISVSAAASVLGSIRTEKKAAASRRNGLLSPGPPTDKPKDWVVIDKSGQEHRRYTTKGAAVRFCRKRPELRYLNEKELCHENLPE